MNEQLLTCQCYGAMMHVLPRNKQKLKRMSESEIISKTLPFVNRVPPKTEQALDNWLAKTVNPNANTPHQLADLSELAELEGLGKKLKKLAKKVVAPIKKLAVDPLKKVFKKLEDSSTVKKIVRPLAYVAGAVTGTVGLVAAADQARNATIAAKNGEKINNQVYQAQQAQIKEVFAAPVAEPVYQAPAAPVPTPQQTKPTPQQPKKPSHTVAYAGGSSGGQAFNDGYGNVQYLPQQQEQPQIVGISGAGIVENIKNNPLPWALGAGALVLLLMRNNQPAPNYQPHYAGASR